MKLYNPILDQILNNHKPFFNLVYRQLFASTVQLFAEPCLKSS